MLNVYLETRPFQVLLKMGFIDLDLQGQFGLKLIDVLEIKLDRTITRHESG